MNAGHTTSGSSPIPERELTGWHEQVERDIGNILIHVTDLRGDIEHHVSAGVSQGIRSIVADEVFMKDLSEKMSYRFLAFGGEQASQWLGKRILMAAVIAVTSAGLIWLAKNGKI
jgi:hypothetical protein